MSETLTPRQQVEQALFSGKNREYGSYVLRKRHQRNVLIGWLVSTVVVVSMYLIPVIINAWEAENEEPEIRQVAVNMAPIPEAEAPPPPPPPEPEPPQPEVAPPQVATKKFVKPELKPDEEVKVEELIPTIDDLKDANPGTETREGTKDLYSIYDPKAKGDTGKPAPPMPKKEEIFSIVQKQPEFPGGMAAFQKFLNQNLNYPQRALDNEIAGTVVVQFVVDRNGNITNPVVLKDIGYGCGEEAIRVVNKMPKWVPGEQAGQRVSVRYTLPIRFRMVEAR